MMRPWMPGVAIFFMLASTLLEGIYKSYMGEGPFTKNESIVYGTLNAICVVSYFAGLFVWINRNKIPKDGKYGK